MSVACKHGQLARVCNICELEQENERLRAELEQARAMFAKEGLCIQCGEPLYELDDVSAALHCLNDKCPSKSP